MSNKYDTLKELILKRYRLYDPMSEILNLIDKAYYDKDISAVENVELYNYYSRLRQYGE